MVSSWMWYARRSDANIRNQWTNYSNWKFPERPNKIKVPTNNTTARQPWYIDCTIDEEDADDESCDTDEQTTQSTTTAYDTTTTFETSKTTASSRGTTRTTTFETTQATETSRTTDHTTTTTFATVTSLFERTTASQAGTLFGTEVSSANDFVASFWDGSQWNES